MQGRVSIARLLVEPDLLIQRQQEWVDVLAHAPNDIQEWLETNKIQATDVFVIYNNFYFINFVKIDNHSFLLFTDFDGIAQGTLYVNLNQLKEAIVFSLKQITLKFNERNKTLIENALKNGVKKEYLNSQLFIEYNWDEHNDH